MTVAYPEEAIVEASFLYWSDTVDTDDASACTSTAKLLVSVDGGVTSVVMADASYGPSLMGDGEYVCSRWACVTDLLPSATSDSNDDGDAYGKRPQPSFVTHLITVASVRSSQVGSFVAQGMGITVVYSDPAFIAPSSMRTITVMNGLQTISCNDNMRDIGANACPLRHW